MRRPGKEKRRDQALLEELSCYYNYFRDFQSSKTTFDSASEEARADSSYSTFYSTLRRTISTPRVRKLTHVDLDELKGCLDLGFGFNYEEMPKVSNTLPSLELCYAIG